MKQQERLRTTADAYDQGEHRPDTALVAIKRERSVVLVWRKELGLARLDDFAARARAIDRRLSIEIDATSRRMRITAPDATTLDRTVGRLGPDLPLLDIS